jgi:hypothetical protein
VDLDGKVVAGVENLDEKGEAVSGEVVSKDLLPMVGPEVVQRFAGEGT